MISVILEHIALGIGLMTATAGAIAWYSANVRKQYAAERDFQHLKRNYESLSQAIAQVIQDQDERFDQLDKSLLQINAILQNIVLGKSKGDSQEWS